MQDCRLCKREVLHRHFVSPLQPRLQLAKKSRNLLGHCIERSRKFKVCAAKGAIIGIDLGTSNSAVAVVKDGTPVIIKVEADRPTLPSVISLGQVGYILSALMHTAEPLKSVL